MSQDIFIREATVRTPRVELDPHAQTFQITGESYPEDINRFYDPVLEALNQYFKVSGRGLQCSINLHYFNSSSARQLMEILDHLDAEARQGRQIEVEWCCVSDDDIMIEFAEDIASEVTALQFQIKMIETTDM
jgi:hypothetical protein